MALLLTETDVRALLTMPDLIAAMETALAAFSAGTRGAAGAHRARSRRAQIVLRADAFLRSLDARARRETGDGLRIEHRARPADAPRDHRDARSRDRRARCDCRRAIHHRSPHRRGFRGLREKTGAAKIRAVLAILGSGVQARSHFEALSHVQKFRRSPRLEPDAEKISTHSRSETGAIATESAEAAVRGADVIVIAASSHTPILFNDWVAPGAHVVSVGATRPTQQEMEPALVARARLFVDSRVAALKESGDVIPFGDAHIVAELGEANASAHFAGRNHDFQIAGTGSGRRGGRASRVHARAKRSGRGLTI